MRIFTFPLWGRRKQASPSAVSAPGNSLQQSVKDAVAEDEGLSDLVVNIASRVKFANREAFDACRRLREILTDLSEDFGYREDVQEAVTAATYMLDNLKVSVSVVEAEDELDKAAEHLVETTIMAIGSLSTVCVYLDPDSLPLLQDARAAGMVRQHREGARAEVETVRKAIERFEKALSERNS